MKAYALGAAIGVGVLATSLAAQPPALPPGWMQTGDAQTCEDKVVPATGAPSARVFSLDCKPGTKGFTSLMQMIASTDYAGKRVRLTAQLRADQLAAWGGLWMRADVGQRAAAFDNMYNRPLRGSFAWQRAEVVLDIPADATALSFGFLLNGAGQLQATAFQLEVVGNGVAVTGESGAPVLPRQPRALTPP
jgi:hypothetical protein